MSIQVTDDAGVVDFVSVSGFDVEVSVHHGAGSWQNTIKTDKLSAGTCRLLRVNLDDTGADAAHSVAVAFR